MTPVTCFSGKNVALFGLGGSGFATAHALAAGGAQPMCWDDNVSSRDKAHAAGLVLEDFSVSDWSRFSALILTPGVPLTHPDPHWTVKKARAAGVEIIGDIELFCRERAFSAPEAPLIAITGTNGKSTTTALTAHILRSAGYDVQMGGNIGTAILALAPPAPGRVHVIEVSSFQIDLAPSLKATVGILINLTPDHLDRHGSIENYAAVKEALIARADRALVGTDDAFCRAIAARHEKTVLAVSVGTALDRGFDAEGTCVRAKLQESRTVVLADVDGIGTLRGRHNLQNAAFAAAAAFTLGAAPEAIQAGMRTFPGLAHRMEAVGRRGRVLFVNDSKATNADAAEKALLSFDRIFWIVGGKAKEGGIEPLRPLFPKIEKAYLIGASTDAFAATLDGSVAYERCGTLDVALTHAARDAGLSKVSEPVVLLSPACASYDQFGNFEVRGERFRHLVAALPEGAP